MAIYEYHIQFLQKNFKKVSAALNGLIFAFYVHCTASYVYTVGISDGGELKVQYKFLSTLVGLTCMVLFFVNVDAKKYKCFCLSTFSPPYPKKIDNLYDSK